MEVIEMSKLEHIVRFIAGHDCIRFECRWDYADCKPGQGGSHGKHGMNILFLAKGDAGAMQFLLYAGWLPQRVEPDKIAYRQVMEWGGFVQPADLGYHSKAPRYKGQEISQDACEFCDGQPCYYDGSGLNANDAMYALVNGGDKALWEFLDGYYAATFEGGKHLEPAEYPTKLRMFEALSGEQQKGG